MTSFAVPCFLLALCAASAEQKGFLRSVDGDAEALDVKANNFDPAATYEGHRKGWCWIPNNGKWGPGYYVLYIYPSEDEGPIKGMRYDENGIHGPGYYRICKPWKKKTDVGSEEASAALSPTFLPLPRRSPTFSPMPPIIEEEEEEEEVSAPRSPVSPLPRRSPTFSPLPPIKEGEEVSAPRSPFSPLPRRSPTFSPVPTIIEEEEEEVSAPESPTFSPSPRDSYPVEEEEVSAPGSPMAVIRKTPPKSPSESGNVIDVQAVRGRRRKRRYRKFRTEVSIGDDNPTPQTVEAYLYPEESSSPPVVRKHPPVNTGYILRGMVPAARPDFSHEMRVSQSGQMS